MARKKNILKWILKDIQRMQYMAGIDVFDLSVYYSPHLFFNVFVGKEPDSERLSLTFSTNCTDEDNISAYNRLSEYINGQKA